MRLRMREFRTRLGTLEYRVCRPGEALRHTALADPAEYGWLVGDHDGLCRLAGLFSFASCSRRTIVHVPLRNGLPAHPSEAYIEACGGRVDLVLVHHSLGLRPADWPRLRRRLTAGRPLTVRTDEQRTARDAADWQKRSGYAGQRDWLQPVTYARTLFLVGSRGAFASAATAFADAAGRGPRQKGVTEGYPVLMTTITDCLEPDPSFRRTEIDISFQAYPPHPGRIRGREQGDLCAD